MHSAVLSILMRRLNVHRKFRRKHAARMIENILIAIKKNAFDNGMNNTLKHQVIKKCFNYSGCMFSAETSKVSSIVHRKISKVLLIITEIIRFYSISSKWFKCWHFLTSKNYIITTAVTLKNNNYVLAATFSLIFYDVFYAEVLAQRNTSKNVL